MFLLDVEWVHLCSLQKVPGRHVRNIDFSCNFRYTCGRGIGKPLQHGFFPLMSAYIVIIFSLHQTLLSGMSLSPVAVDRLWRRYYVVDNVSSDITIVISTVLSTHCHLLDHTSNAY
ncbi:hypothetical protein NPIL_646691 [Nephila pilipes]|uniref:Uncharacterized protein n=1 Tax=Nephila pilipes TaxID=299642 RepID=A0A8X6IJI5_NEPPI|nr:hypothetical protein NPIL_646691 [Nephila pilipes]